MNERWDETDGRWIGRSLARREDGRLVRGAGCFTDDVSSPACLHAAFIRSPHAHARIVNVDAGEAQSAPDVVAVFTGADVDGLKGLRANDLVDGMACPDMPVLAQYRVMAAGQPVVVVLANSHAAAADAAERVSVDYEPLLPVIDGKTASPDGSLFDGVPQNRALEKHWGAGDPDAATDNAAHIVSVSLRHPRLAPTPLEPRSMHARWDAGNATLRVWLSTQTPHRARADLSAILDVEESRIDVMARDVGGAFGMKASLYPEEILVAWAAFALKRSVKWNASRSDDLLAATHGRGSATRGELAVSADGKIRSLRAAISSPLGHWLPYSAAVPAWNAGRILPGPYDVDSVSVTSNAHVSNTAPVGIYRGAGRPEAAMLMERLVDKAAHVCDLDPMDFRRRNLVESGRFPLKRSEDVVLDSGRYTEALDGLRSQSGYDQLRHDQCARRDRGEHVGIGISCYVEPSGRGWESARIRREQDGRFTVMTGSSAQGQARETAYAQIAADVLDVSPADITVLHGDTQTCPIGIGALASRSTAIGGSAVHAAAKKLIAQGDGANTSPEAEARFETASEAWGFGCYLAMVNIDPETGVLTVERMWGVDDAGTVVNPLLAQGQIVGGIAQGLGEALMERLVYDAQGQLLTGSLMDYALPHAADMPPVTLAKIETPSPFNPIGAKGIGEAGTIGAPPAILNAAIDALRPLGVEDLQMPLTSETIWRAIRAAQPESTRP